MHHTSLGRPASTSQRWRAALVRMGPGKAMLAITLFSVVASEAIVLLAMLALQVPPRVMTVAMLLGAIVPALVAPAAVHVVVKLLFEVEAVRAELAEVAVRDALTGLYNRRYFMARLETEVARAERLNLPVAVLMLDIDWFKSVNDRHGHQVGDKVLKEVAQTCLQTLRPYDVMARFGGEEFIALVAGVPIEQLGVVAERVRSRVARLTVPLANGLPLSVTLSIGIGCSNAADNNVEGLIGRADQALYRAKRGGRNRWAMQPLAGEAATPLFGPAPPPSPGSGPGPQQPQSQRQADEVASAHRG